jgi:hypothetical protein
MYTYIRNIKEDDRRILWEGIDVLTSQELREACQERGLNDDIYIYVYMYLCIHVYVYTYSWILVFTYLYLYTYV